MKPPIERPVKKTRAESMQSCDWSKVKSCFYKADIIGHRRRHIHVG